MEELIVRVETDVNLTEDQEKVKKAISNVFNTIKTELRHSNKGSILYAEAKGRETLVKFRNLLCLDRIRNAARKVLLGALLNNTIKFCLNKQVAFAGHISFCQEVAESPLGPLRVTIKCEDPRLLINWLTLRGT